MRTTLTALALAALLLAAGCNKLTKENYDTLKMGMSYTEVSAILGKADNCSVTLGITNCTWGKDKITNVNVVFLADRATAFSSQGLQ